ncbi:MAG: hypothetical protein O2894_06955 [Planctomycetota bacterium]|nr:hypothetical protein [Planctomycetota bacterium]
MTVPRSSWIVLLLAVLACALSRAQADEANPARTIAPGDWALLPINELEVQELTRDHPELVQRATSLGERLRRIEEQRAARPDPDDDGGRRLAEHARVVREQLAPVLSEALTHVTDPVIDERLLAHIASTPPGPLRSTRYALGLVLYVDGVADDVRALLAHVLPRVDGALLVLDSERSRHEADAARAGEDALHHKALAAAVGERLRRLEARWWLLVDYVMAEPARAALHQRLPSDHQKLETPFEHLYSLPEMTVSQTARIRSVLEEVQVQAGPDQALVKRIQSATDRTELRAERRAAQNRLVELQRWAIDEAREILTAGQWQAIEAIPPRVTAAERRVTSVELLAGLTLTPEQRAQLAALRAELGSVREAFLESRRQAAAGMAMAGPDSPEMAGARMEMAAVEAEGYAAQRGFNGRVLREVLTADQVVTWVLTPPARQ